MDRFVQVKEKEVRIEFEMGRECRTTIHLKSLMHTMPVAFKVQTSSPQKFSVRPPTGFIQPLSEYTFDIILKPQSNLPAEFPVSREKFVVKTTLALTKNARNGPFSGRVPKDCFVSRKKCVLVDAKLQVVYIGNLLLHHLVDRENAIAVKDILRRQNRTRCGGDQNGKTVLHIAAAKGNFEILKAVLEWGAELDAVDKFGRTPLMEAITGGQVEAVKQALTDCKTVSEIDNSEAGTADHHAGAKLDRTEIIRALIRKGANVDARDVQGQSALHFAVEKGCLESVKALLQAGADMDARSTDGRTVMFRAAESGLAEVVDVLLEGGADAGIRAGSGQLAAEIATEKGHVEIVEALEVGEALLPAARQGDMAAVAAVLRRRTLGWRAWASDGAGWTALHRAAFKGHTDVVRRLLNTHDHDGGGTTLLRRRDTEGYTALHCAAESGQHVVVEMLLAIGVDTSTTTTSGATAADLATAMGFPGIVELLCHRATTVAPPSPVKQLPAKVPRPSRFRCPSPALPPRPPPAKTFYRLSSLPTVHCAGPTPTKHVTLDHLAACLPHPIASSPSRLQRHHKPQIKQARLPPHPTDSSKLRTDNDLQIQDRRSQSTRISTNKKPSQGPTLEQSINNNHFPQSPHRTTSSSPLRSDQKLQMDEMGSLSMPHPINLSQGIRLQIMGSDPFPQPTTASLQLQREHKFEVGGTASPEKLCPPSHEQYNGNTLENFMGNHQFPFSPQQTVSLPMLQSVPESQMEETRSPRMLEVSNHNLSEGMTQDKFMNNNCFLHSPHQNASLPLQTDHRSQMEDIRSQSSPCPNVITQEHFTGSIYFPHFPSSTDTSSQLQKDCKSQTEKARSMTDTSSQLQRDCKSQTEKASSMRIPSPKLPQPIMPEQFVGVLHFPLSPLHPQRDRKFQMEVTRTLSMPHLASLKPPKANAMEQFTHFPFLLSPSSQLQIGNITQISPSMYNNLETNTINQRQPLSMSLLTTISKLTEPRSISIERNDTQSSQKPEECHDGLPRAGKLQASTEEAGEEETLTPLHYINGPWMTLSAR